jgi:hypothetical protein
MLLMVTRNQRRFSRAEIGTGADWSTASREERTLERKWEEELRLCAVVSGPPVSTKLFLEVHLAAEMEAWWGEARSAAFRWATIRAGWCFTAMGASPPSEVEVRWEITRLGLAGVLAAAE